MKIRVSSKNEIMLNTRGVWHFNPVTRIKESKKVYSRKGYKISRDME